jgi:hypothetical protein
MSNTTKGNTLNSQQGNSTDIKAEVQYVNFGGEKHTQPKSVMQLQPELVVSNGNEIYNSVGSNTNGNNNNNGNTQLAPPPLHFRPNHTKGNQVPAPELNTGPVYNTLDPNSKAIVLRTPSQNPESLSVVEGTKYPVKAAKLKTNQLYTDRTNTTPIHPAQNFVLPNGLNLNPGQTLPSRGTLALLPAETTPLDDKGPQTNLVLQTVSKKQSSVQNLVNNSNNNNDTLPPLPPLPQSNKVAISAPNLLNSQYSTVNNDLLTPNLSMTSDQIQCLRELLEIIQTAKPKGSNTTQTGGNKKKTRKNKKKSSSYKLKSRKHRK